MIPQELLKSLFFYVLVRLNRRNQTMELNNEGIDEQTDILPACSLTRNENQSMGNLLKPDFFFFFFCKIDR